MLKEVLTAFLDIFYPKTCHVCSRGLRQKINAFDDYLCLDCASSMKKRNGASCRLCGGDLNEEAEIETSACPQCAHDKPAYERLFSCYHYEGAARKLVFCLKYGQRSYLSETVVRLMNGILDEGLNIALSGIDCITPIPLYRLRHREREYNQAELIARGLAGKLNKPLTDGLIRVKNTASQSSIGKDDRFVNMRGAFRALAACPLKDKHVLLVDDIVTTTATVREAALELKKAGAGRITILAFAR